MKLDGQRRLLRGAVGTDAWMRRRSGSRSAEGAAGGAEGAARVKAGRSAHRGCAVPSSRILWNSGLFLTTFLLGICRL